MRECTATSTRDPIRRTIGVYKAMIASNYKNYSKIPLRVKWMDTGMVA